MGLVCSHRYRFGKAIISRLIAAERRPHCQNVPAFPIRGPQTPLASKQIRAGNIAAWSFHLGLPEKTGE